jgi:hypothetical protein
MWRMSFDNRHRYYEVFEIAASELDDRAAMTRHFYKLGQLLLGKDRARGIRQQSEWFERRPVAATSLYGEGSEDAEPEAGLAAADREEVGSGEERGGA